MSEPTVSVDTSLLGQGRQPTGTAADAALDSSWAIASPDEFQQAMQAGSMRADAFSTAMDHDGETGTATGIRGKVLDEAKKYLGVNYVWGGTTPKWFDCSGLLQYSLGKYGIHIPRVAYQQAGAGRRAALSELQPGDFVGFGSDVHHIAFYLGNGQILEAPRTGAQVRIRKLGKNENAFGVKFSYPGE